MPPMPMHLGALSGLEEVVAENVPLAPHTWYKIGGPARWFIRPRNVEELQEAAQRCVENNIPIYVLGPRREPARQRRRRRTARSSASIRSTGGG